MVSIPTITELKICRHNYDIIISIDIPSKLNKNANSPNAFIYCMMTVLHIGNILFTYDNAR